MKKYRTISIPFSHCLIYLIFDKIRLTYKDRKVQDHTAQPMGKYKTLCAIIVNDKDEILLTKRQREPFRGHWALISGTGESMKGIAPERGVVEEVRCDLGTNSFKGKYLFSLPIEGDKVTDEAVVFVGKVNEKEIKIQPQYSAGIKWVPQNHPEEFENLAFEHSQIIKEYLKRKAGKKP